MDSNYEQKIEPIKHCQVDEIRICTRCGMEVKKDTAIKRFGKYLCSEQHAQEFAAREQQRQNEESHRGRRGGCC